eukprot:6808883-Prymnesium_polylepis.2
MTTAASEHRFLATSSSDEPDSDSLASTSRTFFCRISSCLRRRDCTAFTRASASCACCSSLSTVGCTAVSFRIFVVRDRVATMCRIESFNLIA